MSDAAAATDRRSTARDVVLLAVLAAVLAALGGAPIDHPDFLDRKALRVLADGGNPQFFRYPALTLYLGAAAYAVSFEVLDVAGLADGSPDAPSFFAANRGLRHAVGLSVTVFFSLAGVVLTYLLARRLIGERAFAFAAAFFLATSILWMADSHFLTVDVPLAALTLAAVYFTLRLTAEGTPLTAGQMAFLGLWVGLAAATKYPGALTAVSVAGATWVCYRRRRWQWLRHSLVAALASIAAFLAANPFVVVELEAFRHALEVESRHAQTGHFAYGYSTANGWLFHLQQSLATAFGWPLLLLAAAGLWRLVARRDIPPAAKLSVLLFPLAFYALIGNSQLAFQRYALPLLPTVALLAALGTHGAAQWAGRRSPSEHAGTVRRLVVALALALALPNAATVLRHDLLLREPDTRSVLRRVTGTADLKRESLVFAERYTVTAFWGWERVTRLQDLRQARPDLIVLDSFNHDRYLYHPPPADGRSPRLELAAALEGQDLGASHRLVISPFAAPKLEVPFSPKSLYSPYPPDLDRRRAPGPFIEIYCRDAAAADRLQAACDRQGLRCDRGAGDEGYYYRALWETGRQGARSRTTPGSVY